MGIKQVTGGVYYLARHRIFIKEGGEEGIDGGGRDEGSTTCSVRHPQARRKKIQM